MAKPLAGFSFKLNTEDLSADFTDRSSGIITAWLWDFGHKIAGVEATSTSQNPTHLFPVIGNYIVSLKVTNADGEDITSFEIVVGNGLFGVSIIGLIKMDSPIGFNPDYNYLTTRIKYWQLYLQNSPNPPIADEDVFEESKWPELYNVLISKIVVWETIVAGGKALLVSLSSSSASSQKGPIKRVETGPSNAEWYDMSAFWSNILKNSANGNILDLALSDMCAFAARVGAILPMCPPIENPVMFEIFHPRLRVPLITWPPSVGKPISIPGATPENTNIDWEEDWTIAEW